MKLPVLAALALLPLTASPSPSFAGNAPPPQTISYVVKPGDLLPQVAADIETVTIEPWGACELQWRRQFTTDATSALDPLPLTIPWETHARWEVGIRDLFTPPNVADTLLAFTDVVHTGQLVIDQMQQTHTLGPYADDIGAGVQTVTIRDDARCDRFEGTGDLALYWHGVAWASFVGGPGVEWNFPIEDTRFRLNDLNVRVTYTLK